jgi:hypothetical protein
MPRSNEIAARAVFPTMVVLRLWIALALAAALFAQKIPPAEFNGTVHGVSKNHIVLETAEGNLVDFDVNGKTRIMRGKKKIELQDLRTGEPVTIGASQEPSFTQAYLMALTITVPEKAKP